jgi:NTE family protein
VHVARETFVNSNYLNDYTLPRVSLIRGRKFLARLREVFGESRIEDLRRTYFCISTNLTTGSAVVHDHGPIAPWVGTSMAVPGVVPPIAYQGDLLCDGGVIDNLPTGVMQGLERGSIIACSVSAPGDIRAPGPGDVGSDPVLLLEWVGGGLRPRFGEILLRTATLTSDTLIQRQAAERADVHIRMPVRDVGLFAWKRLDELVERGYEHALAELTPLRDTLVNPANASPKP